MADEYGATHPYGYRLYPFPNEILAEQLRYIDYALDYCDATDNYPDFAKFRWTCEIAWAVSEYLKCRPAEQIARLKQRVKEGRIELATMF